MLAKANGGNGMKYAESISMLNSRLSESMHDPSAVPDVTAGIRQLIQQELSSAGMAAGRQQTLMDLQKKTTEAESTHDPIIVQNLITALTAFLTEELNEAGGEDGDNDAEGGDGTPDDLTPPEDDIDAGDNGDGDVFASVDAVDGGEENTEPMVAEKKAPPFAKKESDSSMAYNCEACGYEGEMKLRESSRAANGEAKGDSMKEAQVNSTKPGSADTEHVAQLTEAERKIAALESEVKQLREAAKPLVGTSTAMTEADRQELAKLRINERQRELATKAAEAIGEYAKENGVPDSFMRECVKVEDLTAFAESQWPTILGALGRNVEVPREFVGSVERQMPAPRQRNTSKRESGADYLRAAYGNTTADAEK